MVQSRSDCSVANTLHVPSPTSRCGWASQRQVTLDCHGVKGASCSSYRIKGILMPATTSSPAENLPIGEVSKGSGVNIGTIRYYERIKCCRRRLAPQAALGSIAQRTLVSWPSYGALGSWAFPLIKSARLSGSGDPKKLAAMRSVRLQPIISKIFDANLTT
jgi:hypothetical protein